MLTMTMETAEAMLYAGAPGPSTGLARQEQQQRQVDVRRAPIPPKLLNGL